MKIELKKSDLKMVDGGATIAVGKAFQYLNSAKSELEPNLYAEAKKSLNSFIATQFIVIPTGIFITMPILKGEIALVDSKEFARAIIARKTLN